MVGAKETHLTKNVFSKFRKKCNKNSNVKIRVINKSKRKMIILNQAKKSKNWKKKKLLGNEKILPSKIKFNQMKLKKQQQILMTTKF